MLPIYCISVLFIVDGFTILLLFSYFNVELFLMAVFLLGLHTLYSAIIIRCLMYFFPIAEGRFSTTSPEFYRWQAQALIYLFSAIYLDPFVPFVLRPSFYRFFGAKIGKGVAIGGKVVDISLTTLKDRSGVGADAMVLGHLIANEKIYIGKVIVEEDAMVGAKSLISPGVTIKAGATIGAMSLVTSGRTIPENQVWVGIPAKQLNKTT
jgi:acetyltransferase-like isoleucine patch superfamily enzyme